MTLRLFSGLIALFMSTSLPAVAGQTSDIAITSCLQELNLPGAICNCIGQRVEQEFSATQQDFFIATITGDQQAQVATRAGLSVTELTQVAMFMTTAPQQCAAQ